MSKAGQLLTDDEVREFSTNHNLQIPQPEKFATVVIDSTLPTGAVHRYATEDELKAAKASADATMKAVEDQAEADLAARKEAQKRGIEVPLPEAPTAPPSVTVAADIPTRNR